MEAASAAQQPFRYTFFLGFGFSPGGTIFFFARVVELWLPACLTALFFRSWPCGPPPLVIGRPPSEMNPLRHRDVKGVDLSYAHRHSRVKRHLSFERPRWVPAPCP